jgi:hypothetical protein
MDIRIQWDIPYDILITDEFDVFYKEADPTNINNWIKANPTPLPSTTYVYDILGLKPGTVYRFGVSKSCLGTGSFVDQISFYAIGCPIISVYQGPPVIQGLRLNPTLFYSVYYPNSTHVYGSFLNLLDFTDGNAYIYPCGTPGLNMAAPVGRTSYQTIDRCTTPQGTPTFISCNTDSLDLYPLNSSITSALGYYGLGGNASSALNFYSPICNTYGQSTDPILLEDGHEYRFSIQARIQDPAVVSLPIDLEVTDIGNIIGSCTDTSGTNLPRFTPITVTANPNLISGALCYDVLTGQVNLSVKDGTNQVYLPSIGFTYTTEDALGNTLPLVTSGSVVINTSDVTYTVYCPVKMDPLLDPTQLSSGMTVDVFLNDPGPNNICTITNANYTGQTFLQACNNIASYITNNTPYPADVVTIGSDFYIRMSVTGINVVSAQINISGPVLFGPNLPDLAQVPPTGLSTPYRIQDAFIYDSGFGDKIYGTRGFAGTTTGCEIEVSDITTSITSEYSHPIELPASRITLVDVPPPSEAWDLNVSDPQPGIGGLNQAIVKYPSWNDGYVYRLFYDDTNKTTISVTDPSGTVIDSTSLFTLTGNNECARLIEINQLTGVDMVVIVDDPLNPGSCTAEFIQHTGTTAWASMASVTIPSSNEIYKGTITGIGPFTIASVGNGLITVTPNPGWTDNQWDSFRIEITSGTHAGKQFSLYDYAPTAVPPQTNFSNNANTLFVDPNPTWSSFNPSILSPGDQFVFLAPRFSLDVFFDNAASFTPNEYLRYNLVIEDGPLLGNQFLIQSQTIAFLTDRIDWDNKGSFGSYFQRSGGGPLSNVVYDLPYRIYKINDGGIIYNPDSDSYFYSCGNGKVILLDASLYTAGSPVQLTEPGGTNANGAYQFAHNSGTGEVYAITRDCSLSQPNTAWPFTQLTSKHIYVISASGVPLPPIDGSTLWNENIAGNISFYDDGVAQHLYFTSINSRTLYKYTITPGTFVSKTIPPVYKKSSAVELVQGAVHIDSERFVIMNRVNNETSPNILTSYTFTNLFIYDWNSETVLQVLVGASGATKPYTGTIAGWNTGNYGEMFAEWAGMKDYCFGMSIIYNNGIIYWRAWPEDQHYQAELYNETGVAQIWGISAQMGSKLIRIWNIQSNGSLTPSVRSLYIFLGNRSGKVGPVYLDYDTFYNHLIGVTFDDNGVIMIDPDNLTGYYGGPYFQKYNGLTSRFALYTLDPVANTLVWPLYFISDNLGAVTIFGAQNSTQRPLYVRYTSVDLLGPNNTVTATGFYDVDPTLRIFDIGYNAGAIFGHQYVASTNEFWVMGYDRLQVVPPIDREQIIAIINPTTLAITSIINLTTQFAEITGVVGYYYLSFQIPSLNLIGFVGAVGGELVLLDVNTKAILYNGLLDTMLDFKRPVATFGGTCGWIVPYQNGFYLDYSNNTATAEVWSYLTPQTVTYTGLVHNLLNVIYNNTTSIITDDVFATAITGDTFGQWKIADALPLPGNDVVYWNNIPGGGTITMVTNETLELTQFSMENPIVSVENITQAVFYDVTDPAYLNVNTLPTFNTLNSIPFFAIKADNVNLFNNDILQITFANPVYPTCPFITTVTINF